MDSVKVGQEKNVGWVNVFFFDCFVVGFYMQGGMVYNFMIGGDQMINNYFNCDMDICEQ